MLSPGLIKINITPKLDGGQPKLQGSNRSKDREIELINKEVRKKKKRKCVQYKKLIDT